MNHNQTACRTRGGAAGPYVPTRRGERGAALLLVTFILVIVLAGGLAAVSVTSSELASSRGFRTRATAQACAQAGLEHIRSLLPDGVGSANGVIELPDGTRLTYRPGHPGESTTEAFSVLSSDQFDGTLLTDGMNLTNRLYMPGSSGGESGLAGTVNLITTTVTCEGEGFGRREVELVMRYGTAAP